jgi:diacylglycerol kinase (ATP)
MKQALVVYNPVSGSKNWKNVPAIILQTLQKHNYQSSWFETKNTHTQNFDKVFKKKFHRIIVVGGDGTVGQVVAHMTKNHIKTPLVIIAQGSANLLARALGLPILRVKTALEKGLKNSGHAIDVMEINRNQYGTIATGVGYDTAIMKQTSRSLKRALGPTAYAFTILKTFLFYKAKPYHLTLDGKRIPLVAKTVMVFNLIPLGHLKISTMVTGSRILPNDGKLNVIAFNPRSIFDLFTNRPKFQTFTGKTISIKSHEDHEFQIDGDVQKGKTIQIRTLPKAIRIVHAKKFK